jgi:excisionase family DNA binding protein
LILTKDQREAIKLFSDRAGKQIALLASSLIDEMLISFLSEIGSQRLETTITPSGFKKLLAASEVAKILNVSEALAYKLMQSGEIQTVHMGRSVRVRPDDLEEYIRQNSKKKLG